MTALSGCEHGTRAVIEVRSDADIVFSIPEENAAYYCINSVEIRRYPHGTDRVDYDVSWRIRLKPNQSGPCDLSVNYPKTPDAFVTEVASERLAPGDYLVVIDGGLGTALGEFTIGSDTPARR